MMEPLDAIDPSALRALEWLAFDVDDTIADHGRLASRSLEAMERLGAAGVKLAAITGRPLGWAEVWIAQWPIDLAIGENGAGYFVRRGREVVRGFYLDDDAQVAAARARAFAIGAAIAPRIPIPPDGTLRRVDVAFDLAESRRADPEEADALEAALNAAGFRTVRSTIHLHAACGDWDKAKGLAHAMREGVGAPLEGAALHRIAYVGDSPNDAPAFAFVPLSVGVANVGDVELPSAPRYVTRSRASRGFVELADAILRAKEGP